MCIKEVDFGRRPGTHFKKEGWKTLRVNFNKETGNTHNNYDKGQLKNKWDALKIEWKLWKELIGKETSLGWNSSKGTIDASDEWWNNKIKINAEYAKFLKKSINPDMEEKQDRMFINTTATGKHAWAPSCGILPPETEEASMGDVIPLKGNKKGRKVGGAEKLVGQIDRLVNAVESKSIATSLMMKMQLGNSIAHDTRVFLSVLCNENLNFFKPPSGKYYLVDVGYPQMRGYWGPYKGESVIERTFGVWKKR
ncbi:unnamed protein product [Prunus brigantina]